jgi:polysaccharide export outer membrane protein
MKTAVLCASLLALALAACSGDPLREDVIAQARPDGRVAYDVVKIDNAVLATVLARSQPAFEERFKKYVPPPDLKIAVGDTVAVVIWESAANGLFGNSLTELSVPAGAMASLLTGESPSSALGGVSGVPQGLTASPDTLALLFGGAAAGQGAAAPQGGAAAQEVAAAQNSTGITGQTGAAAAQPSTPSYDLLAGATTSGAQPQPGAAPGTGSQSLEALINLAEQSGRAGTLIPDQQVGPDEAISIPYAGRVEVAGRTPVEVQHTIENLLSTKALDPQVLVIVKRSEANSVSVAGEVIGGKRVPLSPGGDRLLQVIAAAGGASAPVHDTFVRLSRGGVTATVPLAVLVANPDQDIFAEPGDVLTLVRRPQTFSVFGATGHNAAITFASDRLSLTEALAKAGGLLDDRSDPRAVFLFRYEPDSLVRALGQPIATGAPQGLSPVVYRLDLKEAKSYLLARRFPVRDKDIIFVANAEIRPIYRIFQAFSQITSPVETGFLTCFYAKC